MSMNEWLTIPTFFHECRGLLQSCRRRLYVFELVVRLDQVIKRRIFDLLGPLARQLRVEDILIDAAEESKDAANSNGTEVQLASTATHVVLRDTDVEAGRRFRRILR